MMKRNPALGGTPQEKMAFVLSGSVTRLDESPKRYILPGEKSKYEISPLKAAVFAAIALVVGGSCLSSEKPGSQKSQATPTMVAPKAPLLVAGTAQTSPPSGDFSLDIYRSEMSTSWQK